MRRISRIRKLPALGMLFAWILMGCTSLGFTYTVVTVEGATAGTLGFSSAEEEFNIYSTRNMYYEFYYDMSGIYTGSIESTFTDFTGKEVAAPVPPGTYKFTLNYRYRGLLDSQDIYWSMFIGFKNYPAAIYIYGYTPSYMRISYGQTITGEITVADMGQTRRLLKVQETDNQTNLVGQKLKTPLKVKVVDSGDVGKGDVDVAFTATPAESKCSFSESSVVKTVTVQTLTDGTVEVPVKLGDVPETCMIKAVCASCAAGKEVTFTATAVTLEDTTEVQCLESGHQYGVITKRLGNPFLAGAYNSVTQAFENLPINYTIHSFVDKSGTPTFYIPAGTKILRTWSEEKKSKTTKNYYTYASFLLGEEEGTYLIKVSCPSCLKKTETYCYGHARRLNIAPPVVESNTGANPDDRAPDGTPYTPVLRISKIELPHENKSFTTAPFENSVHIEAELLPKDYFSQDSIVWSITDTPGDGLDSGTPVSPGKKGPSLTFNIEQSNIPLPVDGRPAPLSYSAVVTAEVTSADGSPVKIVSKSVGFRQDEIDKCRQEYLDYSNLNFAAVPRSRFTLFEKSNVSEYAVGYYDCFAYIKPTRATDVANLRTQFNGAFPIYVSSGYRSPRKNFKTKGASDTSQHMYGEAVDIDTPQAGDMLKLWESSNAAFPKMLEKKAKPNIILKYLSTSDLNVLGSIYVKPDVDLNKNKEPDRDEDENLIKAPDPLEGMDWITLKPYLIEQSPGLPNVIQSAEWLHLGR